MNDYTGKHTRGFPGSHAALGLRVIEVLVEAERPVGPSEIGRVLDVDKSVVHRALQAVAAQGWVTVHKDPDGNNLYAASGRIAAVGQSWLQGGLPEHVMRGTMDELAKATAATVHFAELRDAELVCRERRLAPAGLVPMTAVGDVWPLDSGAATAIAVRAARRRATGPGALSEIAATDGAGDDSKIALALKTGYALDVGAYRERDHGCGRCGPRAQRGSNRGSCALRSKRSPSRQAGRLG